jgi:hypothetical protein
MPALKSKLSSAPLGYCIHTGANAGKKQATAKGSLFFGLGLFRFAVLFLMPETDKPKRLGSAQAGRTSKPPGLTATCMMVLRAWRLFRIRQ